MTDAEFDRCMAVPRVPHIGRILIPVRALREFAELGMRSVEVAA